VNGLLEELATMLIRGVARSQRGGVLGNTDVAGIEQISRVSEGTQLPEIEWRQLVLFECTGSGLRLVRTLRRL
jgi:hypothetical protein